MGEYKMDTITNKGKIIYDILGNITENNPQKDFFITEYYEKIEELLPDYLYKYYSFSKYPVENLINQTACFTNPNLFNDPFDSGANLSHIGDKDREKDINEISLKLKIFDTLSPDIKYINGELEKQNFFKLIDYEQKYSILRNVFKNNSEKLQENFFFIDCNNKINKNYFNTGDVGTNRQFGDTIDNVRIFCLSEKENNSLMWAHYGKNDTGICFKFSKQSLLNYLKGHKTDFLFLVPVYYSTIPIAKDFPNSSESEYEILRYFMIKNEDWTYESEWRFIKYCPNFDNNPFWGNNILAALSAPCKLAKNYILPFIEPESIYLGAKFNLDNIDIPNSEKKKYQNVFLKYLRDNQNKIKFLSFCKHSFRYKISNIFP